MHLCMFFSRSDFPLVDRYEAIYVKSHGLKKRALGTYVDSTPVRKKEERTNEDL